MYRLLLLSLVTMCTGNALSAADAPRPNIIFVLCDDLGYGDVGVFFQNMRASNQDRSEPWHITPNIDRIAATGIQLPHHYCPAPVCAPSRASLLTGVHQGHASVRDNQFDKALEDNHTIATVLREAGYVTAAIGKWGLQGEEANHWPGHPLNRGFDSFYGYIRHRDGHEHYPKEGLHRGSKEVWDNRTDVSADLDKCYTPDLFTARAKHFIAEHRRDESDQPFFLYLAYDTPHAVLSIPTGPYPPGSGSEGGLQWRGQPGQMINTAIGEPDSYYHPDYANATWDDDQDTATPEVPWPDVYKRYATVVRRMDDCLGDLVRQLKDLQIDDNTLIVFTTDNGPSRESYLKEDYEPHFFNSFGPFDGIKRDCFEGGVRVGALARWPAQIQAGRTSTLPSIFSDWLPTFADVAGVPIPARTDGVSLVPTLTGTGEQQAAPVYIEYFNGGKTPGYSEFHPSHRGRQRKQMQFLRIDDHVGVRYDIKAHEDDFEIYDIVHDPQQTQNLASKRAGLQQTMKDTVMRMRRPGGGAKRPYDEVLIPALTDVDAVPGVEWKAYDGKYPWVPELSLLAESAAGTAARPDANVPNGTANGAISCTGYINIPADGEYTFHLTADSGAFLRIHQAHVIDADFGYRSGDEVSGRVRLQSGIHPFQLHALHRQGEASPLSLQWSGPGIQKQAIPDEVFLRDKTAQAKVSAATR